MNGKGTHYWPNGNKLYEVNYRNRGHLRSVYQKDGGKASTQMEDQNIKDILKKVNTMDKELIIILMETFIKYFF